MRVLINDLSLYRQRSGIGCYVAELLAALEQRPDDIQIVRLSRTLTGAPLRWMLNFYETGRKASESTASPAASLTGWRWLLHRNVQFARQFGHRAISQYMATMDRWSQWPLYHEPDTMPLDIKAPTITTVHDLSVLLYPEWHPAHRVAKYAENFQAAVERTSFFLTDAESTRRDMIAKLGLPADRIRVVPLAPRPQFRVLPREQVQDVQQRLQLPDHYLLYVGTIEPRKNVAGLLRAYARLAPGLRARYQLVLAGGWGWRADDVREMLKQSPWNESVRMLGYVSDDDLVPLMNGAECLVYPSFYEGFGLPPLEAMACNCPVITSHGGSLEEVIGDSAVIVHPEDEKNLALTMADLLLHPDLREKFRRRGRKNLERFSWSRTAADTLDAYRAALSIPAKTQRTAA